MLRYGEREGSDVRLTDLTLEGVTAEATITYDGSTARLRLQVPGRYNLANAAAAFAVGRLLGLDPAALIAGAHDFTGTLCADSRARASTAASGSSTTMPITPPRSGPRSPRPAR